MQILQIYAEKLRNRCEKSAKIFENLRAKKSKTMNTFKSVFER